jgi:superfamily II DNA or RNA helicase
MEWQDGLWDQKAAAEMNSIPFVIDNQQFRMSEVLNTLLTQYKGQSLDIATAYFNVGGWQLLAEGIHGMGSFRLLLGDEPEAGADLGLREVGVRPVKGLIKDLANASFEEKTLRLIEDLTAFLNQEHVKVRLYTRGFLHAKSYLFYSGGGFEHFNPVAAIVGSSNFTRAGLLSNKELNLVHRANLAAEEITPERLRGLVEKGERQRLGQLDETDRVLAANIPGVLAINGLAEWYEQQWEVARDFKEELLDLLDASKFGRRAYTPYQVYMKAIYEYFREDLEAEETEASGKGRSAVELSEFQDDAVKKARRLLARYDGVLIADSVGLGKTWIGKKLLEDYAYHQRYRAVVICPAALQKMWHDELLSAGIAANIITQEALGRENCDIRDLLDADVILVDESHNFRNRNTQRYENIERILAANNRRGKLSEQRKKLILLTATPISNNVFDLYSQISLITGGDRSYFAAAGIGDLYRYFLAARRQNRQQDSGIALFNVLEEIVIRRTRPFIKEAYPNATIKGQPIHWPERKLRTIRYNLESTYGGIYEKIVERIEGLMLAPYKLEIYKRKGIQRDQFEEGREEALVGIFKSRYLKRFESSIEAFRISVRRALEFLETFESYILDGKVLDSSSFQKALRFLVREDEEDDVTSTPNSRADQIDNSAEAKQFIEGLPKLDAAQYDLKRLHKDIRKDVDALREIWLAIVEITPEKDAKLLQSLRTLLTNDLKGQKVLLFTYYRDTLQYVFRELSKAGIDGLRIASMDSSTDVKERAKIIARFAPHANKRPEIAGTAEEIDILLATDVLSEGQNLQDCGVLINYDLHWNPTRMVQRAGRIDRIGTSFDTLSIINMYPDDGLEKLLGLVESLSQKIANIDRNGLLDASILGEVVHPQNFNTLRRIEAEDGKVVEEQEQFIELVSSEFLLQNLKSLLNTGLRETMEALPDGIHSGLAHQGAKGVFFYFTAQEKRKQDLSLVGAPKGRRHFWRYIDLMENPQGGRIEENRYILTNLIQCHPDTVRVVPSDRSVDIFALQEKVIASILQASVEQIAIAEAPKILDPIQQTVSTTIRGYIHNALVSRKEVLTAIQRLGAPLPGVYLKTLRKAYETFLFNKDINELLVAVNAIGGDAPASETESVEQSASRERKALLKRDDLKLICFEYVWH